MRDRSAAETQLAYEDNAILKEFFGSLADAELGGAKFPVGPLAVVLIVSIAAIMIWRWVVTPDWVRPVACSYAEATKTLT